MESKNWSLSVKSQPKWSEGDYSSRDHEWEKADPLTKRVIALEEQVAFLLRPGSIRAMLEEE
jgi:hypothetical protein